VLRTLRQPRYAALSVVMLIVTLVCIAAGTWQIYRFADKVHENDALRRNAALSPVPVTRLLPLVGRPLPSHYDYEYRTATVTGTYDSAQQTLVRNRTVGGVTGFLALTPLRTSDGTLLVVRGFAGGQVGNRVPEPPAPPAGHVTLTVRLEPAESKDDDFASLGNGQVEAINPADQQARLGARFFDGYGELLPGQPGAEGLRALGAPNLSNPAGGALEPQHFAYIIQWYLFAMLAIAAPFAMARAESKHQREDEIDRTEPAVAAPAPADSELSPEERRAAKLADRYGRVR